eukprot:1159386-Pelagomonas_calceolata.AAC.1
MELKNFQQGAKKKAMFRIQVMEAGRFCNNRKEVSSCLNKCRATHKPEPGGVQLCLGSRVEEGLVLQDATMRAAVRRTTPHLGTGGQVQDPRGAAFLLPWCRSILPNPEI